MPFRVPSALAIAQARERYDAGASLSELARDFGVTEPTFRRWRTKWGWSARRLPPARKNRAADAVAAVSSGPETEPPDTQRLICGVRRAIEAELNALAAQSGHARGGEARSRALAHLTRTLTLVRELETRTHGKADRSDNADAPPVDVAQLRHELARRIHQLSEEGDDP